MTNYAAGWNMGGYSPDPDSVIVTDDYNYAVEWILENLERWIDQDGDSWDTEDRCSWDKRNDEYLLAVQTIEEQRANGVEVYAIMPDRNGYDHSLWVTITNEPIDEED